MSNEKTNETTTVKRSNKNSMKGKWGKVGAPPKKINWPNSAFTMAALFARNTNVCNLTLYTRVSDKIEDGSLLVLVSKKQPGNAVGRPKSVYVLKENFDSSKMVLLSDSKKEKKEIKKNGKKATPAKKVVEAVAVAPIVPAEAPVEAEYQDAPVSVEAHELVPASPLPPTAEVATANTPAPVVA